MKRRERFLNIHYRGIGIEHNMPSDQKGEHDGKMVC